MHHIAVLDYRITPERQRQISTLSATEVVFPDRLCPPTELAARTGDADIALVSPWDKITKAYLDACPRLKYIGLCGTSTANIDLDELTKRGIAFSNVVSGDKEPVAEVFFMQLVSLARGIGEHQWKPGERHELVGHRIGIIGLGAVGKAMAHMALAYKMDVVYYSPHRKQDYEDKGVRYVVKDELLTSSEIIVLCSPTNVEVLGAHEFKEVKPGSILIQACAGSPFHKPAFYEWVARDGNFALFDMSAGESNYLAYKDVPRVIFPRVVAGDTYESHTRLSKRVIENLQDYLAL